MTAVRSISPAPRNAWLPDGGKGEVMKPCCARCKTPFGHSAVAGTCCHETKDGDRG